MIIMVERGVQDGIVFWLMVMCIRDDLVRQYAIVDERKAVTILY